MRRNEACLSLNGRVPDDHHVPVWRGRVDSRGAELRLIGSVGKLLRLKRETVTHAVKAAVLAGVGPVEEVAGIELDPRIGGEDLEHTARSRILNPCGEARLGGLALIEHEGVIVAAADAELLVEAAAQ